MTPDEYRAYVRREYLVWKDWYTKVRGMSDDQVAKLPQTQATGFTSGAELASEAARKFPQSPTTKEDDGGICSVCGLTRRECDEQITENARVARERAKRPQVR